MLFHVRRTDTAKPDTLTQYKGIRSIPWVRPPEGLSVLEIQTTHTPTTLQIVPDDNNYLTPPYHSEEERLQQGRWKTDRVWSGHWYQDEFFHINEGCVLPAVIQHRHER